MKRYLADLVNASEYNDYVMDTYHDKQLLEPEDNEVEIVPGDDYQEEIQIDFDVDITMDEDMSWDYPDGYTWAANSDDKDGNWYTEDDNRIFINDVTGIVEDIDVMLQTVLPAEAGTYHISGLAKRNVPKNGKLLRNSSIIIRILQDFLSRP